MDMSLSKAIQQVCEQNTKVLLCFLLEARQNEEAESKFVIAISLENEAVYLRDIAAQLQDVLSEFPDIALKTSIMSAGAFKGQFDGNEFYLKKQK